MAKNVNIGASPLDAANLTTQVAGAEQTMETPDTSVGPTVKSPTVKGGFSVPGNVSLDPTQTAELLANMQNMIDQRTGGWNQFMSGMQDTLALATPQRLGGPTQAMAQRASTKRQEQEDIFNMRAQMAALKAGQAQATNQREVMQQILGGGGAGGQGGAASSVFGGTPQIPAEIRQAIAMDPTNGPAILQKYLTTAAGERNKAQLNPAWGALTEVIGKNDQIERVPLWQAVDIAMNNPNNPKNRAVIQTAQEVQGPAPTGGVNQFNVGNVRPAGQTTGFQQPKSFDEGLQIMDSNLKAYGSKHGIDTLRGVISRWAPPNENDTEALIKAASQRLGISADQKIDLSNPAQRQAIGTALMLQEKGPKQLFAAAPTTTRTDVGGGSTAPKRLPDESLDSLKKRTEIWQKTQEKQAETDIATRAKSGEEISKKSGDMIAGIISEARKAPDVIKIAQNVIDHATKHPKEFGYAYQQENKPLAAAANIPGVGAIVEKAAPALFGAPGETDRRTKTDTDANKLGLDFASQMFAGTGARLGVGLEQMAANAKGVGTQFPASTNALNANLIKVAAQKAQDVAKLWDKWAPQNGGMNADANRFVQTPEYQKLEEEWDKRLVDFDKEMAKKFPDVYQPYTKPNRKPLTDIFGAK